jgi:hypothetical protein
MKLCLVGMIRVFVLSDDIPHSRFKNLLKKNCTSWIQIYHCQNTFFCAVNYLPISCEIIIFEYFLLAIKNITYHPCFWFYRNIYTSFKCVQICEYVVLTEGILRRGIKLNGKLISNAPQTNATVKGSHHKNSFFIGITIHFSVNIFFCNLPKPADSSQQITNFFFKFCPACNI